MYTHSSEAVMSEAKIKRPVISDWVKPEIQKHADKYWNGDFTQATNHLVDIGIRKVKESNRPEKEG